MLLFPLPVLIKLQADHFIELPQLFGPFGKTYPDHIPCIKHADIFAFLLDQQMPDVVAGDLHLGLDLVLLNCVRTARLVTPIMQRQGGGAIVNISTFAAFEPEPGFPVSSSLRAALASFCKLFADRYAAEKIRMNNVLPGFIDSYPESPECLARIPMGRYGSVNEIARTVRFLISDEAGYITGQNIRVDGGITRSV